MMIVSKSGSLQFYGNETGIDCNKEINFIAGTYLWKFWNEYIIKEHINFA